MWIGRWLCRTQKKLTAIRQRWTEKRLFRRLLDCTETGGRQELRAEINYIRALTEKAYYEEKLSFTGYMRMVARLEITEKSILKGIRMTGPQATP